MSIAIKSPNADEIWEKFKNSKKLDFLKKFWGQKKVQLNKDQITSAEYVKNVTKAAVFYFQGRTSVKPAAASKAKKEQVDA
ncbi:MAG: hypothetical protein ACTSU5_16025, partial [Promethearchaeota archaeon]